MDVAVVHRSIHERAGYRHDNATPTCGDNDDTWYAAIISNGFFLLGRLRAMN